MGRLKQPLYLIGKGSFLPRRDSPIFKPSFDGDFFHSLWLHRGFNDIICVGSVDSDLPYVFHCLTEDEFCKAVQYVAYKDNSSHGVYTSWARDGIPVYTHSDFEKLMRWWSLPDSLKFRGYRI